MDQNDIDLFLDSMIEKAENDIDIVFAKRLKTILQSVLKIHNTFIEGGELKRTDYYNTARYKKELQFIAEQINGDYKQLYTDIQKLLQDSYMENYLQSGYLYLLTTQGQEEAPPIMEYTIPSIETINQAILNPIAELTLSALLTTHRNEIIRSINIEIGQGLQAGESYSDIAERIQRAVGFSSVKAKRVARTESGRTQSISRLKSAEHAEKYANMTKVWNSTLDNRVRSSHQKLDNQEADEEGFFHFKGYKAQGPHLFGNASLDINCRCSCLFLVNGKRPDLRRARNYQDSDYQQKLANRIDKYMEEGLTEKQAEKKAHKEIKPPSIVIDYKSFAEWKKGLKKES